MRAALLLLTVEAERTPATRAEDPFEGGYTQRAERLDLRPSDAGHGCVPRAAS